MYNAFQSDEEVLVQYYQRTCNMDREIALDLIRVKQDQAPGEYQQLLDTARGTVI